jgi:hypothetical protein
MMPFCLKLGFPYSNQMAPFWLVVGIIKKKKSLNPTLVDDHENSPTPLLSHTTTCNFFRVLNSMKYCIVCLHINGTISSSSNSKHKPTTHHVYFTKFASLMMMASVSALAEALDQDHLQDLL